MKKLKKSLENKIKALNRNYTFKETIEKELLITDKANGKIYGVRKNPNTGVFSMVDKKWNLLIKEDSDFEKVLGRLYI